ncbi:permease prefix domain 1-containing protein [Treponema sp. OttesenSCG-928-L16]|nr:permease prefix domain 1-containing protein [Treponema sp. OttesenSCG-928-L16]
MNTKEFVDNLFSGYEDTEALRDFREELRGNLEAHIADLQNRGLGAHEAFEKATGELGDISALADEISLKKKQELFASVYLKTRSYISTKRMIAYIACAGVFLFGIIAGLLVWIDTGEAVASLGPLLPFGIIPASVVFFLALTQETARLNPMDWRRALIYALTGGIFLFGIFVFAISFFVREAGLPAAVGTLIPFCLPSSLILAFLVFTEKDRSKPWVLEQQKAWIKQHEKDFSDPSAAEKYGLLCGALWIFSLGTFLALGFLLGFRYSWLTFSFTIGGQLLIEYKFRGKAQKR